jgi:hypothetical protein
MVTPKTFKESQKELVGYGLMAIAVQIAVIDTARAHGFRSYNPKTQALLSDAVLAVLDCLRERESLILDPPLRKN